MEATIHLTVPGLARYPPFFLVSMLSSQDDKTDPWEEGWAGKVSGVWEDLGWRT